MLVVLALGVVALLGLIILARNSRLKTPVVGLVEGKLRACASKRNCVCSEQADAGGVAPLDIEGDAAFAWRRMVEAVGGLGGRIRQERAGWLWAEFRTPVFGFADDLEVRLDADRKVIHVRSASRVGRSDWGANRRRVEALESSYRASMR